MNLAFYLTLVVVSCWTSFVFGAIPVDFKNLAASYPSLCESGAITQFLHYFHELLSNFELKRVDAESMTLDTEDLLDLDLILPNHLWSLAYYAPRKIDWHSIRSSGLNFYAILYDGSSNGLVKLSQPVISLRSASRRSALFDPDISFEEEKFDASDLGFSEICNYGIILPSRRIEETQWREGLFKKIAPFIRTQFLINFFFSDYRRSFKSEKYLCTFLDEVLSVEFKERQAFFQNHRDELVRIRFLDRVLGHNGWFPRTARVLLAFGFESQRHSILCSLLVDDLGGAFEKINNSGQFGEENILLDAVLKDWVSDDKLAWLLLVCSYDEDTLRTFCRDLFATRATPSLQLVRILVKKLKMIPLIKNNLILI